MVMDGWKWAEGLRRGGKWNKEKKSQEREGRKLANHASCTHEIQGSSHLPDVKINPH